MYSKDNLDVPKRYGQNLKFGLNLGIPVADSLAVNVFVNYNLDLLSLAEDPNFIQAGIDVAIYLGRSFSFSFGYKGIVELDDTSYDEIVAGVFYRF